MANPSKVMIAQGAGACFGVKRALALIDQVLDSNGVRPQSTNGDRPQVYMLGQLIHNSAVIAKYQAKGVRVIDLEDSADSLDSIKPSTVIVRTHGVSPDIMASLQTNGNTIIDATCPHVQGAQQVASEFAAKYGKVVIIGETGHPEVVGLCGFVQSAAGQAIVVANRAELAKQAAEHKLEQSKFGLIAQTTQRQQSVAEILFQLDAEHFEYEYSDTLCAATASIQAQAIKLAKTVDLMLVVGGKNSANTKHLAQSCREYCSNTYQIESNTEIQLDWLNVTRIGVTGGASTPLSQIEAIADYLNNSSGARP